MPPEADLHRPDGGERQQRQQALAAFRLGERGVFEMKPECFQGGEPGFRGPALGVFRHRVAREGVTGEEQPLAILQALGTEKDRLAPESARLAQHPRLPDAQILDLAQQRVTSARRSQLGVGFQAQAERQPVLEQVAKPGAPDKLPVGQQRSHALAGKGLTPAVEQDDSFGGAGVSSLGESRPKQRDGQAPIGDAQDQEIDLRASQFPVGPIEGQDPPLYLKPRDG